MSWINVDKAIEMGVFPLDVWDANGMIVDRMITGFDPETGVVEFRVLDKDGNFVEEPEGETKKRRETHPAPLTFKKITSEQAARRTQEVKGKDQT